MQQNDNYDTFGIEDFYLVVKWCEYSQSLKTTIINSQFSSPKEYYCIDSTWVNNFKNLFKYDDIKRQIINFKKEAKEPLKDEQIQQLYTYLKCNTILIPKNEKKIIKNIDNKHIYKEISNKLIKKEYNININFCYDNFVLLNKNILDEFKRRQYIINEEPKSNFVLGKDIFIQIISNEVIEVGFFGETKIDIYNYELLVLIKYENRKQKDLEVGKIKGIKDYLNQFYNIKELKDTPFKIINNDKGNIVIINVKNINDENLVQTPEINIYDISNKKGLENNDNLSSGMNSIIQILTSIEELRNYLKEEKNKNKIESFNHIYIFSSYLLKFINKLYSINTSKKSNYDNLEKQMKIIINFINPQINSNIIEQYFLFFLNTLFDELNESELKKTNQIFLESYPSPISPDKDSSFSKFDNYYKTYYKSEISELFNWIRENKYTCTQCNSVSFNYQAFPYLEFDLDKIHEFEITNTTDFKQKIEPFQGNQALILQEKQKYINERLNLIIHIENCFEYLSNYNNLYNMVCQKCNNQQFNMNYFIHKSPKYFIIVLNRKKNIRFEFNVKLDLERYGEKNCEYTLYELMAVLIKQNNNYGNHYFTVIKKDENEWMKFDDNNVIAINTREVLKNYPLETKILIYKGSKKELI